MRNFLIAVLLFVTSSVFAQQHNSMRVVLPSRDFPTYSKFMHTFGFRTLDSLADICHLFDGYVNVTLMHLNEPQKIFLSLTADRIAAIADSLSWLKDVNVFRRNDSSITQIDVKAPGGIMLSIYPSPKFIKDPSSSGSNITRGARAPWDRSFIEFSLRVPNIDSAITFWKLFGFNVTYKGNEPMPLARVSDGEFSIGLHQDPNTEPSLQYSSKNAIRQIAAIRKAGIEPITTTQNKKGEAETASFQAPEGLIFNIYQIHE
ncbi:MAG TPA: hypothetical protein VEW28_09640 [Candidatus Kapabacteria bacterium]|nr:hypothetical protein [Candidatus Kapabacteria bacterium]